MRPVPKVFATKSSHMTGRSAQITHCCGCLRV